MVEVLIAGILLASALTAVSRLSIAALNGSARLSDRARIEAAIYENIQTIQKEDSYFTDTWITDNHGKEALQNACKDPIDALSNHLDAVVPAPGDEAINRTFDRNSIPGILRIVYSFEAPEQPVKKELRMIEMSPNFSANCYNTI